MDFSLFMDSVFIVMDFIEHDLKILSEDMQEPFLQSEVKTLMLQLVSATALMHSQWIVHRDLKTSNLLMNNRGQIKVADFGLARYLGEPTPPLTQLVVTLWYRSPELLLGAKEYGTEVDIWSIGCIFGELLLKEPLLRGKNEVDQLSKVCFIDYFFSFYHHTYTNASSRYSNSAEYRRKKTGLVSVNYPMRRPSTFRETV